MHTTVLTAVYFVAKILYPLLVAKIVQSPVHKGCIPRH